MRERDHLYLSDTTIYMRPSIINYLIFATILSCKKKYCIRIYISHLFKKEKDKKALKRSRIYIYWILFYTCFLWYTSDTQSVVLCTLQVKTDCASYTLKFNLRYMYICIYIFFDPLLFKNRKKTPNSFRIYRNIITFWKLCLFDVFFITHNFTRVTK